MDVLSWKIESVGICSANKHNFLWKNPAKGAPGKKRTDIFENISVAASASPPMAT